MSLSWVSACRLPLPPPTRWRLPAAITRCCRICSCGALPQLTRPALRLPPAPPPPPPLCLLSDDPEWRPVYEEIEFDCNHFGVFENAIDMAHIHYLHGDSFGNQVGRGRAFVLPPSRRFSCLPAVSHCWYC